MSSKSTKAVVKIMKELKKRDPVYNANIRKFLATISTEDSNGVQVIAKKIDNNEHEAKQVLKIIRNCINEYISGERVDDEVEFPDDDIDSALDKYAED